MEEVGLKVACGDRVICQEELISMFLVLNVVQQKKSKPSQNEKCHKLNHLKNTYKERKLLAVGFALHPLSHFSS